MKHSSLISNYCILKEHRLIVEYHEGACQLHDIIAHRKEQTTHPDFSPDYNIIVDIRNLTLDIDIPDIKAFADFCQQNSNIMGHRRNAFITKTPSQVAISMLFKQLHDNLPQSLTVVSTIDAAVNWICSDLTAMQVETVLDDLKGLE